MIETRHIYLAEFYFQIRIILFLRQEADDVTKSPGGQISNWFRRQGGFSQNETLSEICWRPSDWRQDKTAYVYERFGG